jgi:hypothetical protein
MAEFEQKIKPLDLNTQDGEVLKNVKEVKIGSGAYYVDATGRTEIRDANNNVVILIDPNG